MTQTKTVISALIIIDLIDPAPPPTIPIENALKCKMVAQQETNWIDSEHKDHQQYVLLTIKPAHLDSKVRLLTPLKTAMLARLVTLVRIPLIPLKTAIFAHQA